MVDGDISAADEALGAGDPGVGVARSAGDIVDADSVADEDSTADADSVQGTGYPGVGVARSADMATDDSAADVDNATAGDSGAADALGSHGSHGRQRPSMALESSPPLSMGAVLLLAPPMVSIKGAELRAFSKF